MKKNIVGADLRACPAPNNFVSLKEGQVWKAF
jgi:hypothetical protein